MVTVVRESDQDKFVFIVSPLQYKPRTAGTALDNPSMYIDGASITEVNYYKNRLFFFTSVGTVISSRAGEIDNFFLNTAIEVSVIDPIDVVSNSEQRVPIHGSAVVNNAMVLFGDSEQYSLNTSNDVLSIETVNVTKVANYTFAPESNPVYLGTNIAFISNGLTRFYEMTNVYDRGPVDINERSQQIQTQFGQGFNMPVSSREQSNVIVYKRFTGTGSTDMMLYRFRQENSQESSQTSWVRWRVPGEVLYVSMPQDKLFIVVKLSQTIQLWKMDSGVLEGLPATGNSLNLIPKYKDGWTEVLPDGGYQYETRITFPTIYPRGKESYDITSNVTIHRVKFSTAAIGAYNLEIKRKGYDTYNILVEQTPADEYSSEFPPLYGEHIETAPIYTRNKNLTLTMSTDFPAPLTLRSMTWEGDWNPPYYKRV